MSSYTSNPLALDHSHRRVTASRARRVVPSDDIAFEQKTSTLWVVMLAALVTVAGLSVAMLLQQGFAPSNETVAAKAQAAPSAAVPSTDHTVIAADALSVGDAESVAASIGAYGSD